MASISLNATSITVLGIDPGSNVTGWGVVRERSGRLELLANGVLRVKGNTFPERLACIYHGLHHIIEDFRPDEVGVEQVFTSKNVMSTIKLAQARGAAIAACASFDLPVLDYEPSLVRKRWSGLAGPTRSRWPIWWPACLARRISKVRSIPPTPSASPSATLR